MERKVFSVISSILLLLPTFSLSINDGYVGRYMAEGIELPLPIPILNKPPVAKAGADKTVNEGSSVMLDGSASSDPNGDTITYSWTQTAGPAVTLSNAKAAKSTFKAPSVSAQTTLTFKLTVNDGSASSSDTVNVIVKNVPPANNPSGADKVKADKLLITDGYSRVKAFYEDLMKEVASATKTIHVNLYLVQYDASTSSTNPPNALLGALVKAKDRGVDVRLTIHPETKRYRDTVPFLEQHGIPYKLNGLHGKVITIDDRVVYVGSSNFNYRSLVDSYEINIRSTNPTSIAEANRYLDDVWNGRGPTMIKSTQEGEAFLTSTEYFDAVKSHLKSATSSIKLVMYKAGYQPTNPSDPATILLNEIRDAKNRGVDVKVIVDDTTYNSYRDTIRFFKNNSIPFKLDESSSRITHAKTIIIDDTAYIGSANWIPSGLKSNSEATLKTNDPKAVSDTINTFNNKWAVGRIG